MVPCLNIKSVITDVESNISFNLLSYDEKIATIEMPEDTSLSITCKIIKRCFFSKKSSYAVSMVNLNFNFTKLEITEKNVDDFDAIAKMYYESTKTSKMNKVS